MNRCLCTTSKYGFSRALIISAWTDYEAVKTSPSPSLFLKPHKLVYCVSVGRSFGSPTKVKMYSDEEERYKLKFRRFIRDLALEFEQNVYENCGVDPDSLKDLNKSIPSSEFIDSWELLGMMPSSDCLRVAIHIENLAHSSGPCDPMIFDATVIIAMYP